MKKEENIQTSICRYLDLQYPKVIYTSDLSGIKLTIGQAVKAKKQRCKSYKIPDLLILNPNQKYKGLFIEIKKDECEVFGKKGIFLKNEHHESQAETLERLNELGYFATFGLGFEHTKKIIDDYMNDKEPIKIIKHLK